MQAWFHDGQGRRKLQKIEGAPASRGTLGYWQGHLKNISRKCFPSYHTIDVPYRNCTFLTKLFLKTSKFPNKKGTFDVNLVFTATLAWTKRALFITKKGKFGGGWGHVPPVPPGSYALDDGEILRAKSCLRNMDGCTWATLLNFHIFFAFAVSRTQFYSLAKRNFFSRSPIYLYLKRLWKGLIPRALSSAKCEKFRAKWIKCMRSRSQFYWLRKRKKWENSIESLMCHHPYFADTISRD
jgi:hypothetical protein